VPKESMVCPRSPGYLYREQCEMNTKPVLLFGHLCVPHVLPCNAPDATRCAQPHTETLGNGLCLSLGLGP
jgi:hypothetical protein